MSTPDLDLPAAAPSEVGVGAAGVVAFLDVLEAAPDQELHSLVLLRHGQVYARACWAPYELTDATLLYSLSKSFTSTAFGFAVAEGLVGLTDRVVDRLTPRGQVGPRTAAMTLRDLAAMASGHHADTLERAHAAHPDDIAQGFLTVEPESEPGTAFAYNNPATHTLGAVLQEVTGQTLTDYLRPRLFEPLGITPGWWDQEPPGRDIGFTGLHLAPDALARFGQLYLDGGRYAGRQVLPEGWTDLALAAHTPNPDEPNPDWQQGYGFQFWRGRHGTVRGDGAFGQFVVLLPEQDAVLVTTSATENMQGLLDAAWAHLLPALDGGGSAAADQALAQRLTHLDLVTDRPDPTLQPAGEELRVVDVAEEDDGWTLHLDEAGRALAVPAGRERWVRSDLATDEGWGVRVAARGVPGDQGPAFDVVLVETPHRLRIAAGDATPSITWHTAPLRRPSVASLATPRP